MSASIRPSLSRRSDRSLSPGFTLIEILIVVVILGILAGIVVPQLTSATTEARQAMLKDELRFFRNQLQVYRAQHRDVPAGYPGGNQTVAPNETTFVGHMTKNTDATGNFSDTASDTFRYPPYLSKIPENPLSKKTAVLVVTGASNPAPDESQPYGWIYNAETNQIAANLEGTDLRNVPFTSY